MHGMLIIVIALGLTFVRTPDRLTLESTTKDGKWACRWEIFDSHAELTVLKADTPYWFLYEGTAGGEVAWVAFGNTRAGRTLMLIHHEDDDKVDSYWPMQGRFVFIGGDGPPHRLRACLAPPRGDFESQSERPRWPPSKVTQGSSTK